MNTEGAQNVYSCGATFPSTLFCHCHDSIFAATSKISNIHCESSLNSGKTPSYTLCDLVSHLINTGGLVQYGQELENEWRE